MTKELKKPLLSLILLFVASVGLDQGTKQWAYHALLDEGFHAESGKHPVCGSDDQERDRARFVRRHQENVTVIDGLFELRYVENCASAFGMMGNAPEWFRFPFFLVVSVFAAFFIPYLYRKTPASQRLMMYAMPFVLGGAVGNLLDRLFFRYVIDFVDWYIVLNGVDRHWPTFNVADAAIVVGIGLMLLQLWPRKKRPDAAATS